MLHPDGIFLTQQAQSGSGQFQYLLGSKPPDLQEFELDMAVSQLRDAGREN